MRTKRFVWSGYSVVASAIALTGCGTSSGTAPSSDLQSSEPKSKPPIDYIAKDAPPSPDTTAALSHDFATGEDTLITLPEREFVAATSRIPSPAPAKPPAVPTNSMGQAQERIGQVQEDYWVGTEQKVEDAVDRTFRFNVKLWTNWTSTNQTICSGSIVGERTIFTAAHCLFDQSKTSSGWPAGVVVAAAENDGYLPFGMLSGTNVLVDANYTSDTVHNDWGVVTLERRIQGIAGGQALFAANLDNQFEVRLTGYPGDKDRKLQMWTDDANYPKLGDPNAWPDTCGDSNVISFNELGGVGGDSGGGMYIPGYGIMATYRGEISCFSSLGQTLNFATLVTPNRANIANNYAAAHLNDPVSSPPGGTQWYRLNTRSVDTVAMVAAVPSHTVDVISVNDGTNDNRTDGIDYTYLQGGGTFTSATIGAPNNTRPLGRPSAISRDLSLIDVFVEGNDHQLWTKAFNGASWVPSATGWWVLPGETLAGAPTAVPWAPNRIDVFARGSDAAVWHIWWAGAGWSGWESLGGQITGNVAAVSRAPGLLDLFVRGMDGAVWTKAWNGSSWWPNPTGWVSLGGNVADEPTVVSLSSGRLDVFVRNDRGLMNGFPDQYQWLTWTQATGWGSWVSLGGSMTSPPAVVAVRGTNHLDVFGRQSDGSFLWRSSPDGTTWSNWINLGGNVFLVSAFGNSSLPLQILGNSYDGYLYYRSSTDRVHFSP